MNVYILITVAPLLEPLPSWLLDSNQVLPKNQNQRPKYDPLVEEVELLDCNPKCA